MSVLQARSVIAVLYACASLAAPGAESSQEVAGNAADSDSDAAEGVAEEPRPLLMVAPTYPSEALARALEGRVVVCFTIRETGEITDPVVIESSDDIFEAPSLKAVAASKYEPARRAGVPVAHDACRTIVFRLEPTGSDLSN